MFVYFNIMFKYCIHTFFYQVHWKLVPQRYVGITLYKILFSRHFYGIEINHVNNNLHRNYIINTFVTTHADLPLCTHYYYKPFVLKSVTLFSLYLYLTSFPSFLGFHDLDLTSIVIFNFYVLWVTYTFRRRGIIVILGQEPKFYGNGWFFLSQRTSLPL